MTVRAEHLCGLDPCVSRKPPHRLRWAALDRWCSRCGYRWEEVIPFKSLRQLNAYRPECPRCDTSPSRS